MAYGYFYVMQYNFWMCKLQFIQIKYKCSLKQNLEKLIQNLIVFFIIMPLLELDMLSWIYNSQVILQHRALFIKY